MPSGLLRVKGTIDLSQFWPVGESDADTTKVKVDVGANAFSFRPHRGAAFHVTHAFEAAMVHGRVRKAPIDKNGRVTIQLQGIEAPELHYLPQPAPGEELSKKDRDAFKAAKGKGEFRQRLGETATLALVNVLKRAKSDPLPCEVNSQVDSPDEVFDTYAPRVSARVIMVRWQGRLNWILRFWSRRLSICVVSFSPARAWLMSCWSASPLLLLRIR